MGGDRSALVAHYRLERALADRLRAASRQERRGLYKEVYDRLQRESPLYAERRAAPDPVAKARGVRKLLAFVRRFLAPELTFLEVGPGDGALSFAVAPFVAKVVAVDVSSEALVEPAPPSNFQLVLTDGFDVPVPPASIDVAFSNQLMEHLHPEDALEQLESIHAALRPGGVYVCITPSRLTGPHDVSKHFDPVARGLHLKEWTTGELADAFARAGFVVVRAYAGTKGRFVSLPVAPIRALEVTLALLPFRIRRVIGRLWPLRALLGVRLIARKSVV